MTQYKLSYFDFNGGRGEPIRILLHAAGIKFNDDRLSFEQFSQMRSGTRFNSVPVMQIDGAEVTQTNAMMRYVGKLGGFYPEDDLQALYCDEAMGAAENLNHHIGQTMRLQGDELRDARQKLADGWLATFLRGLDALLKRGGGTYFCDGRLTTADLKVFMLTRWLESGALDHIPKDIVKKLAPDLSAHKKRIDAEPIVAAYYASRG